MHFYTNKKYIKETFEKHFLNFEKLKNKFYAIEK